MNKFLLSSAICALALSACTSEDVLEEGPQSDAIVFKNVVNKSSRALSTDNFSSFFVYGYYTKGADLNARFNIYTDTEFKNQNGVWGSSINRYWVNEANYSFYAFSCENSDINRLYGGASLGLYDGVFRINYTTHSTQGTSHDLVFSSAANILGKEENNEPVSLQFKHILSKVSLQFVSDFPEGYQVQISNVSISDFENKGTFTAGTNGGSEGSWGGHGYDANNVNSFTLNTVGNDITMTGGAPVVTSPCYMIPYHYRADNGDKPVKIKFNIKIINPNLEEGNQTIASNTLTGSWHPNWRLGTQYVYTVHLSGNAAGMEQIAFNVGVNDWNEPDADNIPDEIKISLDYSLSPSDEPSESTQSNSK